MYGLSYLLLNFTFLPVLLFFTYRAFIIWERSKLVGIACVFLVVPNFVLGIAWWVVSLSKAQYSQDLCSASYALDFPWAFHVITTEEYMAPLNEFTGHHGHTFNDLQLASASFELGARSLAAFG